MSILSTPLMVYDLRESERFMSETESAIQKRLCLTLDELAVLWTATANGGKRDKRTAASLRLQGVKKGVPDIMIFTPPPSGVGLGLAIELKRPRTDQRARGRVSEYQRIWLERLRACGWRAEVAYGYDHALEILMSAGYLKKENGHDQTD